MAHVKEGYWEGIWKHFYRQRLGRWAMYVFLFFCLVGVFAPFLASSRPLFVVYNGEAYFPLFRYLFYSGFYTKRLDIFFNLLIITLPLFVICMKVLHGSWRNRTAIAIILLQFFAFAFYAYYPTKDPASDPQLNKEREIAIKSHSVELPNWDFDLKFMSPYAKLNLVLRYRQRLAQQEALLPFLPAFTAGTGKTTLPTLWQIDRDNEQAQIDNDKNTMAQKPNSPMFHEAQRNLQYIMDRRQWLEIQNSLITLDIMPLLSPFHWEDDAGGQQALNQYVPWWDLTRINRKDLLAALIFGVRISLVVGITAVALALLIGVPIGAYAGYYGGKFDIIVSRLLEIWEAMPVFFMLLMVVAILQSKSIFLVISVIGLFSWTGFSRYVRGEFFKQRNLAYVEACHALGFRDGYIMFKHILPNAVPPVLTLMPFAMMAAITSEAGLSFLGLGEEGSCSWGVLMDEGRTAFPQESYLLWPPAILLTILLVAIAIIGDRLRDSLDPKLRR